MEKVIKQIIIMIIIIMMMMIIIMTIIIIIIIIIITMIIIIIIAETIITVINWMNYYNWILRVWVKLLFSNMIMESVSAKETHREKAP